MENRDVFLATNLHGRAPCFTASLETAIQAGALAASWFDRRVQPLPMRPANDTLPWAFQSQRRIIPVWGRARPGT